MNSDDPILTACALDELDAESRADFETSFQDDFAALSEVTATRALAADLRTQLQAEPAAALHPRQRAAIFEAARRRQTVIALVPFWKRPVLLSAAAACVIVSVAIRLLLPVVNAPWKATPHFQAQQSGPVFHFTLDNGPLDSPREPLVPFIAMSDAVPAQLVVSPPRILFTQTPPLELPNGRQFLPSPRFATLDGNFVVRFNRALEQKASVVRNSEDAHRRLILKNEWASSERRLAPERLGAFFPAVASEQPAFSLEAGTAGYSRPFWPADPRRE